jgi:Protein of unknown function (DUF3574)
MLHLARGTLSALLLALNTVAPGLTDVRHQQDDRIQTDGRIVMQRPVPGGARTGARPFVRTELYFGTAKPDGTVTEAEFLDFVDQHVTPRFPQGLTLLRADGQFQGEGAVLKEQSFVLILLYPYDSLDEGFQHIEYIRSLYRGQFGQQSVLRVDHPFIVWVSF